MRRFSILLALTAAFLMPGQLQAQETETTTVESELRAMLVEGTEAEADRDVVLDFLDHEAVAEVANRNGFDLEKMRDEVRAMDEDASSDLATRVQDMQEDMVGGNTIVITSTTVIIVLLVLILIAI